MAKVAFPARCAVAVVCGEHLVSQVYPASVPVEVYIDNIVELLNDELKRRGLSGLESGVGYELHKANGVRLDVTKTLDELGVEPVKKSNVISVSYESKSPQLAYQVPDMLIGYQPAYGVAINVESTDSFGSTTTDRLFVAAAVRNGFLIEVAVEGPLLAKVTSTSPYWNGHPSPADSPMAYNGADAIVNSVLFP